MSIEDGFNIVDGALNLAIEDLRPVECQNKKHKLLY